MLQNNNQSMATQVETFFIEETIKLMRDNEALDKWNEKVGELELVGQQSVVTVEKSPIPFLWMNEAIIACFETLCPAKMDIKKYDKTPIPVEILELVSLSNKESHFDYIEIWYNDKSADPVCVGYKYDEKNSGSDWSAKYYAKKYLMGRWADVKMSLDALMERARLVFINQKRNQLQVSIKQQQRELEDLEQDAFAKFGNGIPMTPNLPF